MRKKKYFQSFEATARLVENNSFDEIATWYVFATRGKDGKCVCFDTYSHLAAPEYGKLYDIKGKLNRDIVIVESFKESANQNAEMSNKITMIGHIKGPSEQPMEAELLTGNNCIVASWKGLRNIPRFDSNADVVIRGTLGNDNVVKVIDCISSLDFPLDIPTVEVDSFGNEING